MCDEFTSISQDVLLLLADQGLFSHEGTTRQTRAQAPLRWTGLFVGSNGTSPRPLIPLEVRRTRRSEWGRMVWLWVFRRLWWPDGWEWRAARSGPLTPSLLKDWKRPSVLVEIAAAHTHTHNWVVLSRLSHPVVLLPRPRRTPPGCGTFPPRSGPERPPRWTDDRKSRGAAGVRKRSLT